MDLEEGRREKGDMGPYGGARLSFFGVQNTLVLFFSPFGHRVFSFILFCGV
jgi:hypothetical protein